MIAQRGNEIKVSEIPDDGTWPKYPPSRRRASRREVATVVRRLEWEKRNVAAFIPEWDPTDCIPCGNGLAICAHAAIRMEVKYFSCSAYCTIGEILEVRLSSLQHPIAAMRLKDLVGVRGVRSTCSFRRGGRFMLSR